MALQLFLERFLSNFRLEPFFGIHVLGSRVLRCQLLQALHHAGLHAADLGSPLVKHRRGHAVFPAEVRHRWPTLVLLQNCQDLTAVISGLPYKKLLRFITRESSTNKLFGVVRDDTFTDLNEMISQLRKPATIFGTKIDTCPRRCAD